ncbi:MAG: tetratricopeptide repeat protein [Thiotrichales bacterium]
MQSTLFWLIAILLAIGATVMVLFPLRRGNKGHSTSARIRFALAFLIPLTAFGVYAVVGNPGANNEPVAAEPAQDAPEIKHDLNALIDEQAEKLRENPDDAAGWAMLAVSQAAVNRWDEAEQSYAKAYALEPEEAFILSGYAEAISVNAGRDLSGKPIELVRKALELHTQDEKALELAGIHAYQREEYSTAAYYWRQLLKVLPPEGDYARDIQIAMRDARQRSHLAGFEDPEIEREIRDGSITGTVVLAPEMQARVTGAESLYLVASVADTPLATMQAKVEALPLSFTLDDSLAATPEQAVSQRESLALTVWVSKSGASEPSQGDLRGHMASVKVGEQGVNLVIDSVVP